MIKNQPKLAGFYVEKKGIDISVPGLDTVLAIRYYTPALHSFTVPGIHTSARGIEGSVGVTIK